MAHTLQWGNVQEFITWIVAAAALGYAARAAHYAKKADRESQANKVAAWIEPNLENPTGLGEDTQYRISNQSGQPVFNFTIWHTEDTDRGYPLISWVVPPGEYRMAIQPAFNPPPNPMTVTFRMPIKYMFADIQQRKWAREYTGTLTRLSEINFSNRTQPGNLIPVDPTRSRED